MLKESETAEGPCISYSSAQEWMVVLLYFILIERQAKEVGVIVGGLLITTPLLQDDGSYQGMKFESCFRDVLSSESRGVLIGASNGSFTCYTTRDLHGIQKLIPGSGPWPEIADKVQKNLNSEQGKMTVLAQIAGLD